MKNERQHASRRDESGQALILALVFLVLCGVLVVSILGLVTTNLIGTSTIAAQRTTTYSADSAVMGALEELRSSSSLTTICPSTENSDLFSYQVSGGPNIVVSCTLVSTIQTNLYVSLIATENSTSLVNALATLYTGQTTTYGTQLAITSWSDTT